MVAHQTNKITQCYTTMVRLQKRSYWVSRLQTNKWQCPEETVADLGRFNWAAVRRQIFIKD